VNFDVIVRNGSVVDGSGAPAVRADVGLVGDRIAAVSDLSHAIAELEIDATGGIIAPGFIDAHTHSDFTCFLGDEHENLVSGSIRQGVTTEIVGNCGFSAFPWIEEHRHDLEVHVGALFGQPTLRWHDLAGYASHVRAAGSRGNLAPLLGHGSLRAGAMGLSSRRPDTWGVRTMLHLLEEALEQGAVGLSSGLVYAPGMFADTNELITLCRPVARLGRPYTSHIRSETGGVYQAVQEAVSIGKQADIAVHISHHKAAGRSNWGRTEDTLKLIDQARHEGLDVTIDMYPYTAGSTLLSSLLPPWVQEAGLTTMVERLRDSTVRDRIRTEIHEGLPSWQNLLGATGWDSIVIANCSDVPDLEGKSVAELAEMAGKYPDEYALDLLIEARGRVLVILHMMSEGDVRRVLSYDATMIGSDGIPLPGKPHPRWAGTFARTLSHYVRVDSLFSIEAAIHRMTMLPAERFGLSDRGHLSQGKIGDLVVLAPEQVVDRATYAQPLLPPQGISHVLVSGQLTVSAGALTLNRPGKVLTATN
jgi:N-acyl-D-amino-acid deacylase